MVVSVRIAILQRFGAAVGGARALTMILYGLHGFNHGGAKALAASALARLIEAHGIIVLTKPDWDAKKAELGDAVLN